MSRPMEIMSEYKTLSPICLPPLSDSLPHCSVTCCYTASSNHTVNGDDSRPAALGSMISEEWLKTMSVRVYELMWLFNGDCLANALWAMSRLG